MSNDEMFFLCVLTGAKKIIGINNPVEGLSKEEAKVKWREISKSLYEKEIIYNDHNGEICIKDEYAKIAAAISFPDIVYICPVQDETTSFPDLAFVCPAKDGKIAFSDLVLLDSAKAIKAKYIYIKGAIYLQLIQGAECQIKLFESREEFIELLNKEFMFVTCENDINIEISAEDMEKAVKLTIAGEIKKATGCLKEIGVDEEKARLALDIFSNYREARDYIGVSPNQETPSEIIFKTVKTEEGTWIYKLSRDTMKIRRCNPAEALSEVLNF